MTAELIVMNKNGLALAADSAVTVSVGGHATKVYNSANKLFTLSMLRPVGVMIYGSAEIMGLPWEVVIKRYREELADRSFESLEEYVEDLFNYLKSDAFTPDCYGAYVRQRAIELFGVIVANVDETVKRMIGSEGEIDETKIEELHKKAIDDAFREVRDVQKELGIARADIRESMSTHRDSVRATITKLLEKRPVKGAVKRKLIDACLIAAIVFPGMNQSGLVIAGFGDGDIFPSAKAFEIHKILDGNIQFSPTYEAKVTLDSTVHIRAFAQSNETQNFMNGMSERIHRYISEDMQKVLAGAFSKMVTDLLVKDGIVQSQHQDECNAKLSEVGAGVHAYILNQVREMSRTDFSGPVVDAVNFFSPTEMAAMAETLVSLESFRQQVTLRSETVGGPIDVSVITRGDGFIWIKRKHYFKPELNHHFFSNYTRNLERTNEDQND